MPARERPGAHACWRAAADHTTGKPPFPPVLRPPQAQGTVVQPDRAAQMAQSWTGPYPPLDRSAQTDEVLLGDVRLGVLQAGRPGAVIIPEHTDVLKAGTGASGFRTDRYRPRNRRPALLADTPKTALSVWRMYSLSASEAASRR